MFWRDHISSSVRTTAILTTILMLVAACEYDPAIMTLESLRVCEGQEANIGIGYHPNEDPPEGSTYNGTSGDDIVVITNGPVTFNAEGGNDIICVSEFANLATEGQITINAGDGNDTVVNKKPASTPLFVDGGPGTDTCINVVDSLNCGGSTVDVRAKGAEGTEIFQLWIRDVVVETFAVGTAYQTFSFEAPQPFAERHVKVEFINDQYDPANGINADLVVDYIEIDGTTFQTEADSVFSTGTWHSGGVTPGFPNSETLHTNGYFHYGQGESNPGELRLVSSQYQVSEGGDSVRVQIARQNGSDGPATIQYSTNDLSATAGDDYSARSGTASWADGQLGIRSIDIPIIEDALAEFDEQFSFVIENPTGDAELLAPRTATITIDDNDSIASDGEGLLGEYYDGPDFTDRFLARIDPTIDFDWQSGAPASGMQPDTFSVRWSGQVEPLYDETYTFTTRTDDGVRLWVNDELLIDEWAEQAVTEHSGTVTLEAGVKHNIIMEFFEDELLAEARLSWSSASQTSQIIPASQLFPAPDPGFEPGDDLVKQTLTSGLNRPISLDWNPDGSIMYIALRAGDVRVIVDGVLDPTPFVNFREIVNYSRDRGLMDLAAHPDFDNHPYIYLLFTYDPPETANHTGLAGVDGLGNRAGRLIRVTADASTGYRTAVPGSEVVLLGANSTWNNFNAFVNSTNDFDEPPGGINPDGSNVEDFIATDSESHSVGAVDFGTDGNLFVSIGDGASYNSADPRGVRVQDIDNLSGKVLRIDPITGEGLADNPFYNGNANANRSKVYHYGLRNPFRLAVHPETGRLFVGDVGWFRWDEINSADAGANFGWPFFEGGDTNSERTPQYESLPEAIAFYNSGQPVEKALQAFSLNDPAVNALILGDVYQGDAYPSIYQGNLFYTDFVEGTVHNISFDAAGEVASVGTFATGAEDLVQLKVGPDGNMYYVDLVGNSIGRWVFQ